jgi:hypothetical protein
MGRGPRIDPELYCALQQNIQSLDNTAACMTISEGTSPTTMKNRNICERQDSQMAPTRNDEEPGCADARCTPPP